MNRPPRLEPASSSGDSSFRDLAHHEPFNLILLHARTRSGIVKPTCGPQRRLRRYGQPPKRAFGRLLVTVKEGQTPHSIS